MNTLKLTSTEDGRIKVRVVSPSERDQSAVVTYDELQEAIRLTQTGDEAELPLEPDDPAEGTVPEPGGIPSEGDPNTVPPDQTPAEAEPGTPEPVPEPPVEGPTEPDQPATGDDTEAGSDPATGEDTPVEGEPDPVPDDPTGDVPEEPPHPEQV